MTTELATQAKQPFDLSPQTFDQALTFSQYLADSDMVPKDFKGKPGNCLIAIQWGMEVGLKPLQALQNIAVINGRPSLWGDALIALVRSSPLCEYVIEEVDSQGTAVCRVKRRGESEQARSFSDQDAKTAGLLGKQGPWTTGPKRMKQMRARAFALRDVFPDVLKGMPMAEEVIDLPSEKQINMGAADVVQHKPLAPGVFDAANAAAADGVAAYSAFWKSATPETRKAIGKDEHERLKAVATDADKARTVENAPAPAPDAPVVTYAVVMDKMAKAKNLDALYVGADWIGEVADPDQRAELSAKFEEFKTALEAT